MVIGARATATNKQDRNALAPLPADAKNSFEEEPPERYQFLASVPLRPHPLSLHLCIGVPRIHNQSKDRCRCKDATVSEGEAKGTTASSCKVDSCSTMLAVDP